MSLELTEEGVLKFIEFCEKICTDEYEKLSSEEKTEIIKNQLDSSAIAISALPEDEINEEIALHALCKDDGWNAVVYHSIPENVRELVNKSNSFKKLLLKNGGSDALTLEEDEVE